MLNLDFKPISNRYFYLDKKKEEQYINFLGKFDNTNEFLSSRFTVNQSSVPPGISFITAVFQANTIQFLTENNTPLENGLLNKFLIDWLRSIFKQNEPLIFKNSKNILLNRREIQIDYILDTNFDKVDFYAKNLNSGQSLSGSIESNNGLYLNFENERFDLREELIAELTSLFNELINNKKEFYRIKNLF